MAMGLIAIAGTVISAGVSMYTSNQNAQLAEGQANTTKDEAARQEAKLDKQKAENRRMTFKNPFQDMENVYEDLTVDQRAAEFQMERGDQQRADIMQSLRGAAGTSGIAGLAQSLANQGQLQARQVSADIGRQEQQNRMMMAQDARATEMAERGGEAVLQEAEMSRQATLLGVAYGGMAGANAAVQQAYANQQAGMAAAVQMTQDRWNTASNMVSNLSTT